MQEQQQREHISSPSEEQTRPASTLDAAIQNIAEQIGEEPSKIKKLQDMTRILERMNDGVIIDLHISRPSFVVNIAPKRGGGVDFGLEKLGITNSQKAQQIIKEYFSLGRHSLIPMELQKELASIVNSARACLDRYALTTHWGHFIPFRNHAIWKEENEKYKESFFAKKQYILDHYDEIVEQVLRDYRTLAEEVWKQVSFGSIVARNASDQDLSEESFEQWQQQLNSREKKSAFIQTYVSYIQSKIPSRVEIEDGFAYKIGLGYIPLPSLLANDIDEADHVARDRALRDAKLRKELDVIKAQEQAELQTIREQQRLQEAQQRAEWQTLNAQQQAEQQANYLKIRAEEEKLQAEQEKIRLQQAMDKDIRDNARKQKDELVQEFYTGVVAQINVLVKEVCDETLVSLAQHDTLRGPVSVRLRNLVQRLKNFNFIEDEQIDSQIKRLEAALPTHVQREKAKSGNARIEISGIRRVVQKIQQEAEQTLLELDLAPRQRRARQDDTLQMDTLDMTSQPRQSRQGLDFTSGTPAEARRRARTVVKL